MDIEELAKILQALSSNDNNNAETSENSDNSDNPNNSEENNPFGGIDLETVMKMGEVLSQMNRPDKNSELLLALKPHLSPAKRQKVDSALKLSKMLSLLPFLKESGILKDLF